MEKFITATGKTIDLAIAAALEQLRMDRDSVSVEVLDNPKSGFLGIGAQPARVKVTRYRRNITLEPMNAYERHVIHAALQDHPDVTTFSTGTEPNRRIVVAYSRYKSAEAAVKEDFPETEEE